MGLEGIDRQFITERDVLEGMDDGNDAQVLGMGGQIRSMGDIDVLKQTSGWQEHIAECKKDLRISERKLAEEAEEKDRKYCDLAEVWNIHLTI